MLIERLLFKGGGCLGIEVSAELFIYSQCYWTERGKTESTKKLWNVLTKKQNRAFGLGCEKASFH